MFVLGAMINNSNNNPNLPKPTPFSPFALWVGSRRYTSNNHGISSNVGQTHQASPPKHEEIADEIYWIVRIRTIMLNCDGIDQLAS